MELIKYIPPLLISVVIAAFISIIWVNRINHMMENHFDYKGEDFLDDDDKIQIG
jgi:hypothetical protein